MQCRYWSYLCYSIFHKGFFINQWNNAHVWQASLTNILCKSEEHNVSTSCIYLAQQEKKNGLTNCLAIIPSILKSCNLRRTKNVPVFFSSLLCFYKCFVRYFKSVNDLYENKFCVRIDTICANNFKYWHNFYWDYLKKKSKI